MAEPDADRVVPFCECHGIPMLWATDPRTCVAGGFWYCREKRREYNRKRSAQRIAWVKNKEATDPFYQISRSLQKRRWAARQRIAQRHLPREE